MKKLTNKMIIAFAIIDLKLLEVYASNEKIAEVFNALSQIHMNY